LTELGGWAESHRFVQPPCVVLGMDLKRILLARCIILLLPSSTSQNPLRVRSFFAGEDYTMIVRSTAFTKSKDLSPRHQTAMRGTFVRRTSAHLRNRFGKTIERHGILPSPTNRTTASVQLILGLLRVNHATRGSPPQECKIFSRDV
jgi:hypothetical protein